MWLFTIGPAHWSGSSLQYTRKKHSVIFAAGWLLCLAAIFHWDHIAARMNEQLLRWPNPAGDHIFREEISDFTTFILHSDTVGHGEIHDNSLSKYCRNFQTANECRHLMLLLQPILFMDKRMGINFAAPLIVRCKDDRGNGKNKSRKTIDTGKLWSYQRFRSFLQFHEVYFWQHSCPTLSKILGKRHSISSFSEKRFCKKRAFT